MAGNKKDKSVHETIISSFQRVHRKLGHGFLEKVYVNALQIELEKACLNCLCHLPIQVYYDRQKISDFYADLIVDEEVIIKVVSADTIHPSDEKELLNTMKATEVSRGIVLNFGMQAQHVIREMEKEVENV